MTEKNQESPEPAVLTPRSTRSQSRKAQQPKRNKTTFVIVAIIAILVLIGTLLFTFVIKTPLGIGKTPTTGEIIKFRAEITPPEGWRAMPVVIDSENPPKASEQNPEILENKDGTCEYLRQIFFAPANQAGRGDDYLTRNYLYQLAGTNNVDVSKFSTVNIATEKRLKPLVALTFDYPVTNTVGDKQVEGKRAVAVRAIDSLQATGDENTQGIPFVSMSYSCQDKKDYSTDVWDALLKNTQVILHSDNS